MTTRTRAAMAATLTLAAACATLIGAPSAAATTYNNDSPIIIPASSNLGPAGPYPSSITVTGTAGPITDVNVGLDGFTHDFPFDVAIVLVAPNGQALKIQDCASDGSDAVAAFLTFDDAAAAQLPGPGSAITSGIYRPTSRCAGAPRSFPSPGPLTNYGSPAPQDGGTATFASVFNGLSPIGTWRLFVLDAENVGGGTGSIPGGWSLDIKPDVTPPPTPPALTCGTGTVQSGAQCVVQQLKKKKKKRKKRRK